jgi:hypothetical protein
VEMKIRVHPLSLALSRTHWHSPALSSALSPCSRFLSLSHWHSLSFSRFLSLSLTLSLPPTLSLTHPSHSKPNTIKPTKHNTPTLSLSLARAHSLAPTLSQPSLALQLPLAHTLSHPHSHTLSLTLFLARSRALAPTLSQPTLSLQLPLTHTLSHKLSISDSHSPFHSIPNCYIDNGDIVRSRGLHEGVSQ